MSHRILNVLRIKNNDELIVFNHKMEQYLSCVSMIEKSVTVNFKEKLLIK